MNNLCVVSFGGGVNSTALLIGMHERGDRPDAILFADTGGEKPETYEHIERVQKWIGGVGFPPLTTVGYTTSAHGTLEQECLNNETLPSKAFGFGGCSVKWKRAPMDRWVAAWPQAVAALERGEQVQRLIGLHAGEMKRGKIPDDAKYRYRYPLREWGWVQADCEAAHVRAGLKLAMQERMFLLPFDAEGGSHCFGERASGVIRACGRD